MNTAERIHKPMIEYWKKEYQMYEREKRNLQTKFVKSCEFGAMKESGGDAVLQKVTNTFMYGFGETKWSPVQIRIFTALIDSVLPKIYGSEWEEVRVRVLKQRGLDRLYQETLCNLARRNGKTFVTAGGVASLFLSVPSLVVAVFSVGRRQSQMLLNTTIQKIEEAFAAGTHVKREDYKLIQKNAETLIYEYKGHKQVLGCFPGSVKVSDIYFPSPFFFQTCLRHSKRLA